MKGIFFSAATLLCAALACSGCMGRTAAGEAQTPAPTQGKVVIYQMLVRLFGNSNTTNTYNGTRQQNGCGRMSDISVEALQSIKRLGCNYVWYTGIIQQASKTDWSDYGLPRQCDDVVKGNAGSPYAICDYYAVSADIADDVSRRADEFEALVARTHQAGLKVMMDFVPNHVARQYQSVIRPDVSLGAHDRTDVTFDAQNNFYYFPGQTLTWRQYTEAPAKVTGNDVFHSAQPSDDDWYETVKLNYGREYLSDGQRIDHFDPIPSTWHKMTDILLFWASKGVDGFRCDMSEMVPSAFWHYSIARVRQQYPHTMFVAEIYNPQVYAEYIAEGGFDYLYDKVELYDSLRAVVEGRRPIEAIEACLSLPTYTDARIAGHMLHFLENHDEQRIASAFFGGSPQAAIPALYVSALLDANPYMHYFAGELGEDAPDAEGYQGADGRTTIFDYWGLERQRVWKEAGWDESKLPASYLSIRRRYEQVFKLAQAEAVTRGTTVNVTTDAMRAARVFSFTRQAGDHTLTVIANFGDQPYTDGSHTVPAHDAIAY